MSQNHENGMQYGLPDGSREAHSPYSMAQPALQQPMIDEALSVKAAQSALLLQDAVARFGRVVYANSLGAEAMVLTDLICEHAPAIDIITIDTGRLPEETLALLERLESRYARRIRVFYPDAQAIERYVREHGINGFYNSLGERLSCCQLRKVEPFKRALLGYAAWVTGVRREQSEQRGRAEPVIQDEQYGLLKISPLLDWSESEIWSYIRTRGLPYNALHDRGYPSIGCAPCTRTIEPGQDHRAGRWWWELPESRECGLHPRKRPVAVS
jgi:phosphoadenosine phosphosulfate reductase